MPLQFEFSSNAWHPLFLLADTSATGLATYVVEPNFRDSFCVAHPTPRFSAVLEGLPSAVVAERVSHPLLHACLVVPRSACYCDARCLCTGGVAGKATSMKR
jgi:hypothetical protein